MDKVFKEITRLKCPDTYFLNLYKNRIKILIEKTLGTKVYLKQSIIFLHILTKN
mgnify:CR=1 FL=1